MKTTEVYAPACRQDNSVSFLSTNRLQYCNIVSLKHNESHLILLLPMASKVKCGFGVHCCDQEEQMFFFGNIIHLSPSTTVYNLTDKIDCR